MLAPEASEDLDDIWEYITADNLDAADRWVARLFDAFDQIAQNPGIGHRRTDLTNEAVLFWPVGRYLIIYRIAATVGIVAVTQGSRDIPQFLRNR